jgi:hypothetical protein
VPFGRQMTAARRSLREQDRRLRQSLHDWQVTNPPRGVQANAGIGGQGHPDTKKAAKFERQLDRVEVAVAEKSAATETNGKPPDDRMPDLAPLEPAN